MFKVDLNIEMLYKHIYVDFFSFIVSLHFGSRGEAKGLEYTRQTISP